MSTWDQQEIAVTQTLQRIEKTLERIEARVSAIEQSQSWQKGQAGVITVFVSAIVSAVITIAAKLLWTKG